MLLNLASLILPLIVVGGYVFKGMSQKETSKNLLVVLFLIGCLKQFTFESHPHMPLGWLMIFFVYFLYATIVLGFGIGMKYIIKKIRNI